MMTDDEKITAYFDAKKLVHEIFGYNPDWVEIPLDDGRGNHWMLTKGESSGSSLVYAREPLTRELVETGDKIYNHTIYTQRFLPKWVYRSEKHVLVCVDTHTDGNKFLMILDAHLECTDQDLRDAYGVWG